MYCAPGLRRAFDRDLQAAHHIQQPRGLRPKRRPRGGSKPDAISEAGLPWQVLHVVFF